MRLETAHRILIGTFVAFALFFGVFELRALRAGGGTSNLLLAILSFVIGGGFLVYLRRFGREP